MGLITLFVILATFPLSLPVWLLWASFSTGGYYELKQMNPDYPVADKNLSFLLGKLDYRESKGILDLLEELDYRESKGILDSRHVEQCSVYMPNWDSAADCVTTRIACERQATQKKSAYSEHVDIWAKEFQDCFAERRPVMSPVDWLRFSRTMWRLAILLAGLWVTDFTDQGGKAAETWEAENRWWVDPVKAWAERGQ